MPDLSKGEIEAVFVESAGGGNSHKPFIKNNMILWGYELGFWIPDKYNIAGMMIGMADVDT